LVGPRSAHWMGPSDTPNRAAVKLSTSMSSFALPLFCVQQPLQSESAQVSMTRTTIIFDPDFRHRSWCFNVAKSGNTETMSCDWTQLRGMVGPQPANMPSYWQPLYLMHSSLPGSG